MRIGAVGAGLRRGDRARRGVDMRAADWGPARIAQARRRSAGPLAGKDSARAASRTTTVVFRSSAAKGLKIVRHARGAQANVGVAGDGCIHGNEIIFALKLEPDPREVDERHRFRSRSARLVQKIAQGARAARLRRDRARRSRRSPPPAKYVRSARRHWRRSPADALYRRPRRSPARCAFPRRKRLRRKPNSPVSSRVRNIILFMPPPRDDETSVSR